MNFQQNDLTNIVVALCLGVFVSGCLELPNASDADQVIVGGVSLNDTGVTSCADYPYDGGSEISNLTDCFVTGVSQRIDGVEVDNGGDPVPAGQDALFGRDVTMNDPSDGVAGFSFTKLDISGNELDASATNWSCVRDNVTGLVWEKKTNDGGLQDKGFSFTWYRSDGVNDGGDHGVGDTGLGVSTGSENGSSSLGSDDCYDPERCDSEKYMADVNSMHSGQGLCGFRDWRLPSIDELMGIIHFGRSRPTVDVDYFPNTEFDRAPMAYLTSTPDSEIPEGVNCIDYSYADLVLCPKFEPNFIRLVR